MVLECSNVLAVLGIFGAEAVELVVFPSTLVKKASSAIGVDGVMG